MDRMRKRIGDIFVEKGILTQEQLGQVLDYAKANGLRLGDAGVKMGIIKPQVLLQIFGTSNKEDFFYLDTNYYPQVTQGLFDVRTIIQYGVLPLGFKTEMKLFKTKKLLNIGLLSPEKSATTLPELERLAKEKLGPEAFHEFKVYLILAEQLTDVLAKKYNFPEDQLRTVDHEMDERLILFLDSGSKILSTKLMDNL